jgi:pre-mRNA-processing factor 17
VQEYNYHLQPCNTITFIDQGRKFITTSDDKKMLVWEMDIPVPIKYIAEPDMHCIPSITHHPKEDFLACQSMDNKIVIYSAGDKVKLIRKKLFKGHNNSGYACQVGFSANGKFLMSGDGLGVLTFWDWRSTKIFRKFQAHDGGPCMSAIWHPLHNSRVATCGWDSLIKIWE